MSDALDSCLTFISNFMLIKIHMQVYDFCSDCLEMFDIPSTVCQSIPISTPFYAEITSQKWHQRSHKTLLSPQ